MTRRGAGRGFVAPLLLLVAAIAAGGGATAAQPAGGLAQLGQIDADTVQLDVTLRTDGDAGWEIRYRVRLDDENTTAAFDSLERDVRANRSAFASRFGDRIDATVAAAENATGREMAARNVTVRTTRQEIPQRYGVLVYAFEWTGFAATDGSTVRAGDAIEGLYLDGSTSLTIRWPQAYGAVSTEPPPDEVADRSATWRGPAEFAAEQPRVVVAPEEASGEPGSGGSDGAPPPGWLVLGGVILVALVAAAAAAWWWRRRPAESSATTTTTEPPEELLSNEERVLRLLREHDGRMRQQQVVEELGWTDAKTSQVVGQLRESGAVEGFRLGRENVLRLPDEDEEST